MKYFIIVDPAGKIVSHGTTFISMDGYETIEVYIEEDHELLNDFESKFSYEDGVVVKDLSLSLESLKTEKIAELNGKCESTIAQSFQARNGHTYQFEMKDQLNFSQQFLLITSNPDIKEVLWKTEDAGVLTHSREEFVEVIEDAENHKRNNISRYWALKEQVNQASTIEEIKAIEW